VAATNVLIKNKVQLTKEAALKCVLMDVEGLALLNCFNGLANDSEKVHNSNPERWRLTHDCGNYG